MLTRYYEAQTVQLRPKYIVCFEFGDTLISLLLPPTIYSRLNQPCTLHMTQNA